jgi:hypothetical protein
MRLLFFHDVISDSVPQGTKKKRKEKNPSRAKLFLGIQIFFPSQELSKPSFQQNIINNALFCLFLHNTTQTQHNPKKYPETQ